MSAANFFSPLDQTNPKRQFFARSILGICLIWGCLLFPLSSYAEQGDPNTPFEESVPVEEENDPLEGLNRSIFWFNDTVDVFIFEPIAVGYDFIVPGFVQTGVGNFFDNIRTPIYLVSDLVQFKFSQFAVHTARFLITSTIGIGGLIDVAQHFDLEKHHEDFGTALGYRGVPSGPYLVIPFLGPSNIRDAFGRIVDAFLNPTFYTGVVFDGLSEGETYAVSGGLYLLDSVNTRASLLEAVDSAKGASLDYYLFVRSAYGQIRANQIYDGNIPGADGQAIDEFDDGFEFDDEEEDETEDRATEPESQQ